MRKDEPRPMSPAETPSERPPAAGEDPVASLFSADRTLPAPVVAPEVNESELTRWKSARDSLFGESVKDPAPAAKGAAALPPARTGRTLGGDDEEPLTEGRRAVDKPVAASKARQDERTSDSGTPLVRALSVSKIGAQHEAARTAPRVLEDASDLAPPNSLPKLEAPNKKKTALHAGAPPPPAAAARGETLPVAPPLGKRALEPSPAGKKARPDATGPTRTKKKTPPPRPASGEVVEPAAKKKFRRGPKPLLLAALTLLVLAAGGVSAVVLEIVPDPLAEPAAPVARRGVPTNATAAAPSQPTAATAPAAAAPQAEVAQPTVAAPAPAASSKTAPKAAAATAPQPQAPKPVVAAAPSAAPMLDDAPINADNDQLISLARKALAEENAAQAEALARRALAKEAGDHHAMEVLARALIDQDRGPEAVAFARRIVDKRKKRVPYRLLLGDALLMVGDAAGARREWQAAAELEPNNREVKQRLQ
jgi:hypothetical protein